MSIEQLSLSGFKRVRLAGAIEFKVTRSAGYGVNVHRNWSGYPRVHLNGETLVVDDPWYDIGHWFTPWLKHRVDVEMPELCELSVSGASVGTAAGFDSPEFKLTVRGASRVSGEIRAGKFDLDAAGASRLDMNMTADELRAKLAGASRLDGSLTARAGDIQVVGASRLHLKGSVGKAKIDAAGASHLELEQLLIRTAGIKLAGASHCRVTVDTTMDAEVVGASRLVYAGNPAIGTVKSIGASQLVRA